MSKTLLYIFDHLDWQSRMPVAKAAQKAGYEVMIGIVGAEEHISGLEEYKILFLPKPKNKFGPLSVLKTIDEIRTVIKTQKPDLLHTVTLKYSFLVGIASLGLSGYRLIYTIAGLGFLFRSEGIKPFLIRLALSPLLKSVLKNKDAEIIFQNPDDRDLLLEKNYVRRENTHLVISSGVDLSRFEVREENNADLPIALMPTRLVHEKGVAIFVEAARALHAKGIKARYQIAGGLTIHNPRAISASEMQTFTSDGIVEWLGHVEDMPSLLQSAHVIVYPSYYGEGVPRVMIEACAAGRPIITTDHAGCRETVPNGENGILVPVKEVQATADAMQKLLTDAKLRKQMGRESRKLAEIAFDEKIIVAQTLEVYNLALVQK
ncbi:MAG: glycosyltransferase family 4 protein [Alphaproteobacteria bacterium]